MAKYRTEIQQVNRRESSYSIHSLSPLSTGKEPNGVAPIMEDLKRLSLAVKISNSLARGWAFFSVFMFSWRGFASFTFIHNVWCYLNHTLQLSRGPISDIHFHNLPIDFSLSNLTAITYRNPYSHHGAPGLSPRFLPP